MNELYVNSCWLYFKTNAENHDQAVDQLINACAEVGVDINIEEAELRDLEGNSILKKEIFMTS